MKKILFAAIFTFIMVQSAMALSVSANGGAYVPIGSYGNMFNAGYDYGLTLEEEIFIFTSLKLNYHRYHAEGKSGNDWYSGSDLDGDAVELMLKVAPFDFIVEPYIAAGGGYYNNRINTKWNKYTQDGFGFVGEAGFNVSFFIMSVGINAKYYSSKLNGGGRSDTAESFTVGAILSVHIPLL